MRYYGNVMTTTIWRLRILHLQQYSRRLNLFVRFLFQTGVIVLTDNVNRDKQLNTADSVGFIPTSILVKCFL